MELPAIKPKKVDNTDTISDISHLSLADQYIARSKDQIEFRKNRRAMIMEKIKMNKKWQTIKIVKLILFINYI